METRRRLYRFAALVAVGGCMVQLAGCVSGLAPALFGLGESTALYTLLSAFLGG